VDSPKSNPVSPIGNHPHGCRKYMVLLPFNPLVVCNHFPNVQMFSHHLRLFCILSGVNPLHTPTTHRACTQVPEKLMGLAN
jgi:hypothetical protein